MSCIDKYYLSRENLCLSMCSPKLTSAGIVREFCPNCPYDCETCDNYANCLTCNDSDNRGFNHNNKRCEPKKGYYEKYVSSYQINCFPCPEHCLSCRTPTFCAICEDGYFFDQSKKACVESLISPSQKAAAIVIGSITITGIVIGIAYAVLTKMQIINKKINPRKIRAFTKLWLITIAVYSLQLSKIMN